MDIQTSKIELVKIILNSDNDKFIEKLKEFVSNEKSDFWLELSSSEQAEIKDGIKQLNQGKRKQYQEILNQIS